MAVDDRNHATGAIDGGFGAKRVDSQKVLIAEDCSRNASLTARILAEIGCAIDRVTNGDEAVEKCRGEAIDLILMDIKMPEKNGLEALRELKNDPATSSVPIIILTGFDSTDMGVSCIESGADDYLVKPVEPVLLKARVAALLERKRLREFERDVFNKIERDNQQLERRVVEQVEEIEKRLVREADLLREKDHALNQSRIKDKFISLLSHDLRSPLTSVAGALRLMLTRDIVMTDISKARRMLTSVSGNVENLMNMIDNLLHIDRLQTGQIVARRSNVPLQSLTRTVAQNLTYLTEEKQLSLSIDLPEDLTTQADYQLIYQVMQNLLVNAIKFSPPSGQIRIYLDQAANPLRLAVTDRGEGIPNDIMENLFDWEVRVSTPGTAGERGSGLGLSLCKEIMDAHGGAITVNSTEGEGATFYLTFANTEEVCEGSDTAGEERKNAPPTILIVDDEEIQRSVICQIIENEIEGSHVCEARHGAEAMDIIESGVTISLIVSDLMMPMMDGFSLLEAVRANESTRAIPVICITSDREERHREKALGLGANAFFRKPVDAEILLASIRSLTGRLAG